LGNNSTATSVATPAQVLASPGVPLSGVTALAAGANHSCARLSTNAAKCWGANESGQLGNGSTASSVPTAVAVSGSGGSITLGAGLMHSCAVTATGTVLCWGANGQGQLGNNTTNGSSVPVRVLL
jgi:alpha-tubulin suppressor-like RCC1 family protein